MNSRICVVAIVLVLSALAGCVPVAAPTYAPVPTPKITQLPPINWTATPDHIAALEQQVVSVAPGDELRVFSPSLLLLDGTPVMQPLIVTAATLTPTNTPTSTPTNTNTATRTSTPTSTPTLEPTPTHTPTLEPTEIPLPTVTPTATITPHPVPLITPVPITSTLTVRTWLEGLYLPGAWHDGMSIIYLRCDDGAVEDCMFSPHQAITWSATLTIDGVDAPGSAVIVVDAGYWYFLFVDGVRQPFIYVLPGEDQTVEAR